MKYFLVWRASIFLRLPLIPVSFPRFQYLMLHARSPVGVHFLKAPMDGNRWTRWLELLDEFIQSRLCMLKWGLGELG
jgi:hypothetical protein